MDYMLITHRTLPSFWTCLNRNNQEKVTMASLTWILQTGMESTWKVRWKATHTRASLTQRISFLVQWNSYWQEIFHLNYMVIKYRIIGSLFQLLKLDQTDTLRRKQHMPTQLGIPLKCKRIFNHFGFAFVLCRKRQLSTGFSIFLLNLQFPIINMSFKYFSCIQSISGPRHSLYIIR